MKVYVFGSDIKGDNIAYKIADVFENELKDIEFIRVATGKDLVINNKKIVIIDAVDGINKIKIFSENDISKIRLTRSITVHDWDLGFQLKYLKKIGKIDKIFIIGIPIKKKINYLRVKSILRKFVEQDMQGS